MNTINFSKVVGSVKIGAKERAGFSRPRKPKQSEQWKQRPKRSSDSNKSDNASFYEDNDCENGYTSPLPRPDKSRTLAISCRSTRFSLSLACAPTTTPVSNAFKCFPLLPLSATENLEYIHGRSCPSL